MSNLYYSPESIGGIYANDTNDTNMTNDYFFTIEEPIIYNSSEQYIVNNDVTNNINNIKNDLLTELMNNSIGDFEMDPEVKKFIENSSGIIIKYKNEQKKMLEYEKIYNTELNNTNNSIKSLVAYSDIAKKLETEYVNSSDSKQNITNILDNINEIVDKMKDNKKLNDAKDNFFNSKKKMLSYIQFVKFMNKDNLGSTCSICFSNQVNHYINPCGHTLCSSCISKLNVKSLDNCMFCRKQIISINSLYYI
uniref:RING-type domain-containing protein n=1 Tax=viral metagenome TaxID=1070528 RepID=A0A6C0CYF8_9ZZZZ